MNSLKGKKILVTGSEGFIGSHLVERLVSYNANVTGLVLYNFSNNIGNLKYINKRLLNKVKIEFGDLTDQKSISSIIKKNEIIINLAALIGIPYSYKAPESYYETNVKGLMNILDLVKNQKVIHTSTSEVYGTAKYTPIDEFHSLNGQSPYSASKIAADQLAMSYYYSFGKNISIIRPFNTFGPRQSDRAFIPTVINQLLSKKNTIKLGDIKTRRDLTYIDDTVDGFIKCILAKGNKTNGQIINLGTGTSSTMKEIANFLIREINPLAKIIIDKKRLRPKNSEVLNLISNNKKAAKLINWRPKHKNRIGLYKALIKTIDFYKNYKIKSNSDYVI